MAVCENTIQQMYIRTLILSLESGCLQWMHALFYKPNHTPAQVKTASFLHIVPTIKDPLVWFVNSSHVHLQCFEVPNRHNHVKHSYVSKNPQHPTWLCCASQWEWLCNVTTIPSQYPLTLLTILHVHCEQLVGFSDRTTEILWRQNEWKCG